VRVRHNVSWKVSDHTKQEHVKLPILCSEIMKNTVESSDIMVTAFKQPWYNGNFIQKAVV